MRCITLDMIDHVKQNTQVELAMFDINYLFQLSTIIIVGNYFNKASALKVNLTRV